MIFAAAHKVIYVLYKIFQMSLGKFSEANYQKFAMEQTMLQPA